MLRGKIEGEKQQMVYKQAWIIKNSKWSQLLFRPIPRIFPV
jgi:hypothetical protein